MQIIFSIIKLIFFALSIIIYLFYFNNIILIFEAKIVSFLRIDSFQKYVNEIYLSYYDLDISFIYFYSLYNYFLDNINYFKNHVIIVYNIFLSK